MHIRFHVGGPRVHPVEEQATIISTWLDPHYKISVRADGDAFGDLEDVDLLVPMGMYWPGMSAEWAGSMTYTPIDATAQANYLRYCDSGRPMLIHHGAIGCYSDWPEFAQRLGVKWGWQRASHSPFQHHTITIGNSSHPIVTGLHDFTIEDEIYYKLWMDETRNPSHHMWATWDGEQHPMLTTLDANARAGKAIYSALGHNLRSIEPPALRRLWRNSVDWLLSR
ncbi:MAG: ThuA domain-containing protein [Chloroflexales bacterium]|nr:ThuA domain-containing protein [Chloroflexales bacterium]